MPTHKNPFVKGDLFIVFKVEFPTNAQLDTATIDNLRGLLPKPDEDMATKEVESDPHVEVHYTADFDSSDRRPGQPVGGPGGEVYDEDGDEEGGGRQRVQCRQQ